MHRGMVSRTLSEPAGSTGEGRGREMERERDVLIYDKFNK